MKPTAISLFSGGGGIDLAFSEAGFDIVDQVEVDPFCREVLKKHAAEHWPNARIHTDIRTVDTRHLTNNPDVLMGGFPCQDISVAGQKAGLTQETRSGLWFEFARLIGDLRPKYVFLENVANITRIGGTRVIADLAKMGYDAEWCIIPASAIGAGHTRKRWFCVAYPNSLGRRQGRSNWYKRYFLPHIYRYDQESQPEWERRQRWAWENGQAVVYPTSAGLEGEDRQESPLNQSAGSDRGASASIICRAVDGLRSGMDRHRRPALPHEEQYDWESPRSTYTKIPNRAQRVKVMGNGVVWQLIYPFAVAIKEALDG